MVDNEPNNRFYPSTAGFRVETGDDCNLMDTADDKGEEGSLSREDEVFSLIHIVPISFIKFEKTLHQLSVL